jgi:hypothetical protein
MLFLFVLVDNVDDDGDGFSFQSYGHLCAFCRVRYRNVLLFGIVSFDCDQQLLEEMQRVKRQMKQELEESTNEFRRQLVDMDVRISGLRQKETDLQERRTEVSQEETKLKEFLRVLKQR